MQPNGNFKLLNLNPYISIDHKDLEAIRHIVDIAPQEAQWFCRLDRTNTTPGTLEYRVYEMYIPEQICSAAQVESDPMMMVRMFQELQSEHGNQGASEIMKNMTVWCHSHVNMGVSPSGQDVKQFAEQCKNAIDAKQTTPQMMMIFNKKDMYYCKLYDPEIGLVFENIPMKITGYDFSNITSQAKDKFKKPVAKKAFPTVRSSTSNKKSKNFSWSWSTDDDYEEDNFLDFSSYESNDESFTNYNNKYSNDFLKNLVKYYSPNQKTTARTIFSKKLIESINGYALVAFNEAIHLDPNVVEDSLQNADWVPTSLDQMTDILISVEDYITDTTISKPEMLAVLTYSKLVGDKLDSIKGDIEQPITALDLKLGLEDLVKNFNQCFEGA